MSTNREVVERNRRAFAVIERCIEDFIIEELKLEWRVCNWKMIKS